MLYICKLDRLVLCMKTIGIIGGMSYESSIHYYERINKQVNEIMGDLNCAQLLIYNVNFQEIRKRMLEGKWDEIGNILVSIAKTLEGAGADAIVIATNTIHKVADYVESEISVPLIHIADAVSIKCQEKDVTNVGLIGTRYTMEENFIIDRLARNGIKAIVPEDKNDISSIDRIIFDELCKGQIKKESKEEYLNIINKMIKNNHIEGIILGCTEIEMLIKEEDLDIPIFDTTQSHIDAIVNYCLNER